MMNLYRVQHTSLPFVFSQLNPVLLDRKSRLPPERPRDQAGGGGLPGEGGEQVHGPAAAVSVAWSSMEAPGDCSANKGNVSLTSSVPTAAKSLIGVGVAPSILLGTKQQANGLQR